jgi:hypothetical protein
MRNRFVDPPQIVPFSPSFLLVGKPEVFNAPLTVLAEQRCRRKAIHSADSIRSSTGSPNGFARSKNPALT